MAKWLCQWANQSTGMVKAMVAILGELSETNYFVSVS